jgi:hypothetical protein
MTSSIPSRIAISTVENIGDGFIHIDALLRRGALAAHKERRNNLERQFHRHLAHFRSGRNR